MRVQLPVSSELLPVKQPLTSVHCQCNTLPKLLQLYSTPLSWLWIIAAGAGTDWHAIGGRPAAFVYILATRRQAVGVSNSGNGAKWHHFEHTLNCSNWLDKPCIYVRGRAAINSTTCSKSHSNVMRHATIASVTFGK
jgi:hypothetical protein